MPGHDSIDGLIIRVFDTGDHDRYLTVLTADRGRISVLAKGSRSVRGQQVAISQLYTYGNFEFYRKGSTYILKGGSVLDPFYSLSTDIDRLSLASYLCDMTYELTDEGEPAPEMLRLLLNSLYAINKNLYSQEQIKGAFEFRAAVISGYEPDFDACNSCGCREVEQWYLDVMNGAILCQNCLQKKGNRAPIKDDYNEIREAEVLCPISAAVRNALHYCIHAPLSRLFAFELKDHNDLGDFSKTTETYLLSHLGRSFDSLNFYHTMRKGFPGAKGT